MATLPLNQPQIIILDQHIKMVEGLYSLNDLHKASGGEKKYQPTNFMRNEETQALISEIEQSSDLRSDLKSVVYKTINGGAHRGTYVCKELVYRYAMWVSAKFSLIVIRVFDAVARKHIESSLSTPDERAGLRAAVTMLTTKRGLMHDEAYRMVHQYFNVGHIEEIPREQLPAAVEYVQRMALVGEVLPPTDEQRRRLVFAITLMTRGAQAYLQRTHATEELWLRIAKMKETAGKLEEELEAARQSMQALSRDGAIWDELHEAQLFLDLPSDIMKEGHEKAQDWR